VRFAQPCKDQEQSANKDQCNGVEFRTHKLCVSSVSLCVLCGLSISNSNHRGHRDSQSYFTRGSGNGSRPRPAKIFFELVHQSFVDQAI